MKTVEFRKEYFSEILANECPVTNFLNSLLVDHVVRQDWKIEDSSKLSIHLREQGYLDSCVKLAIGERCIEVISLLIELLRNKSKRLNEDKVAPAMMSGS
jgi:hypothetical protein